MRSSLTTSLAALAAMAPSLVRGDTTTSASINCVTITATTGSTCPTPSLAHCVMPDCVLVSTVTLSCGCASIYTDTQCQTGCPTGCGITYSTAYLPCAANGTMATSSPTMTAPMSRNTSMTSSSSSVIMTLPPTTHIFPNSTAMTSQQSQPSSQQSQSVPVTTSVVVVTPTGPSGSTPPSSTASVTPVTNEGSRYGFGIVEGGVLVGLIGAVLGMM